MTARKPTTRRASSTALARPRRAPVARKTALGPQSLATDVRQLIVDARQRTATAVNAALTTLYWQIGRRIRQDMLKEKRAEYFARILQTLSAKSAPEFDRGFGQTNLASMVRFAEAFPVRR